MLRILSACFPVEMLLILDIEINMDQLTGHSSGEWHTEVQEFLRQVEAPTRVEAVDLEKMVPDVKESLEDVKERSGE